MKPIEGTLLNPNHMYVTFLSGLGVRKCQGCPIPIEQVPATFGYDLQNQSNLPFPQQEDKYVAGQGS